MWLSRVGMVDVYMSFCILCMHAYRLDMLHAEPRHLSSFLLLVCKVVLKWN